MIFTFYKAQGLSVGSSLVEEDKIPLAADLIKKAEEKGVKLLLPTDVVVADKFAADADSKVRGDSSQREFVFALRRGTSHILYYCEARPVILPVTVLTIRGNQFLVVPLASTGHYPCISSCCSECDWLPLSFLHSGGRS